jgi:hypothetical protein
VTNYDFTNSNLSKIKPKLRTAGRVSGNFGKNKVRAGSTLNELGVTSAEVVNCITQDEYLSRLQVAFEKTEDPKLKEFVFTEIRKILIQRGVWGH